MKKAILFATVLAVTAACSSITAEAAGAGIKVATKENCQEWVEQLKENNALGDCLKWGTIIVNGECPSTPETPIVPGTPGTPETPVVPESPGTPEQSPSEGETEEMTFARRVVALVNEERAKAGLGALTIDEGMEQAALVRAQEIQTSFSHTRPNGTNFSTALKEAGVTYRSSGENIAWGQKTPEEVVNGWMNSAGHRANILNANYSRIGVGHLQNTAGTSYWVQLFAN